jgi:hypothetical protein
VRWLRYCGGAVVGKHRTNIDRTGLDPNTKEGGAGKCSWVRAYRSLHALSGGDHALMRHWLDIRALARIWRLP